MNIRLCTSSFGVIVAALASAIVPSAAVRAQEVPVAEVRGSGGWFEWSPDGVVLDDITINAWKDADGNVGGTVTWTSVYHGTFGPGPGSSGYPWFLEVTNLTVSGNIAIVDAVLVSSPQDPWGIGTQWSFIVIDSGASNSGVPDEFGALSSPYWGPVPIDFGNFTVWSAD